MPKKAETEHIQRAHVIRELISTEKDFEVYIFFFKLFPTTIPFIFHSSPFFLQMDLCIIVNRLVIPLRFEKITFFFSFINN